MVVRGRLSVREDEQPKLIADEFRSADELLLAQNAKLYIRTTTQAYPEARRAARQWWFISRIKKASWS